MPPRRQATGPDPALVRRVELLEMNRERELAERVEQVEGGHALLNPGSALIWDNSFLVVEPRGRSARQLAELAAETLGPYGFSRHAVACLDPADAPPLEAGFNELGWEVERGVWMLHDGPPDRPASVEAVEVDGGEILELRRELIRESWAGDYSGDPGEITELFLAAQRQTDEAAGGRWFAAAIDGVPASCCALLSDGGIGQVEWVATAESARNGGLARAVVLAAVEASRDQGDELTMVGAEADDWPRKLYRRLGFEPVGEVLYFLSPAPG